ncbi:terminase small subunit [Clostridium perfringens]|nr:terminase small subunit [Clostridium perfringens]
MARARSPNRYKAKELYLNSCGDIKLKTIAEELNISYNQVRKWKSEDKWDEELKVTVGKVVTKKNSLKKNNGKPFKKEVKELIENDELTDNQRLFCAYYINCFNATKAYKKAYNCSYDTAMVEGCKSLRNPKIKNAIDELREYKLNKIFLTKEDIFQRYLDIAYASMTDYLEFGTEEFDIDTKDGTKTIKGSYIYLKDSAELDGSVISEVKQGKSGISLKLHDALRALDWLSEHMNIATDKQKAEIELLKANVELTKVKKEQAEKGEWD